MKIKYLIGALACTSAFATLNFTNDSQVYSMDITHEQDELAEDITMCHYEFNTAFDATAGSVNEGLVSQKKIGIRAIADMHVGSTTDVDLVLSDGHDYDVDMILVDDSIGNPFLSKVTLENFIDSDGTAADTPLKDYLLDVDDASEAHDEDGGFSEGLWLRNHPTDADSTDGDSVFFIQGLIEVKHVDASGDDQLFDNVDLDIIEGGAPVAASALGTDLDIDAFIDSCDEGPGVESELTDYIQIDYDPNTLAAVNTMIGNTINTDTFDGTYADWAFYSDKYNQTSGDAQTILIESDVVLTIAEDS